MQEPLNLAWIELLFEHYDYRVEGEKLFPVNPPDPARLMHLQNDMEVAFFEQERGRKTAKIIIKDHGIANYNLPLVYVERRKKQYELSEFKTEELLNMPIYVETKERMSHGAIVTLLYFYILYPLRTQRQKKRDSIAMFLNVLCQKAS